MNIAVEVPVVADTRAAERGIQRIISKAKAGVKAPVIVDTKKAEAELDQLKRKAKSFSKASVVFKGDTKDLNSKLQNFKTKINKPLQVKIDTSKTQTGLDKIKSKVKDLGRQKIEIKPDTKGLNTELQRFKTKVQKGTVLNIKGNTRQLDSELQRFKTKANKVTNITLKGDASHLNTELQRFKTKASKTTNISLKGDTRQLDSELQRFKTKANRGANVLLKGDSSHVNAELQKVKSRAVKGQTVKIQGDTKDLNSKLDIVKDKVRSLRNTVTGSMRVNIDTNQAEPRLNRLRTLLQRATFQSKKLQETDMSRMSRGITSLNHSVNSMNQRLASSIRQMQGLVAAAGGLYAVSAAMKGLAKASDSVVGATNKLALVAGPDKAVSEMNELYDISYKTSAALSSTAETYFRFGQALGDRTNVNELKEVAETINKALAIGGSTGESGRAAIFQLGQGLAAEALRGQELNSVMEQTPRIAKMIANHLEVGVGKLRAMAEQGKLTSKVIIDAVKGEWGQIESEFRKIEFTIASRATITGDALARYFHKLMRDTGFTNLIKSQLDALTGYFNRSATSHAQFVNKFVERMQKIGIVIRLIGTIIVTTFQKTLARSFVKAVVPLNMFEKVIYSLQKRIRKLDIAVIERFTRPFRFIKIGRLALLESRLKAMFQAKDIDEFRMRAQKVSEVFTKWNTGLSYIPTQVKRLSANFKLFGNVLHQQFDPSILRRIFGGWFAISHSFGELFIPIIKVTKSVLRALNFSFADFTSSVVSYFRILRMQIEYEIGSMFGSISGLAMYSKKISILALQYIDPGIEFLIPESTKKTLGAKLSNLFSGLGFSDDTGVLPIIIATGSKVTRAVKEIIEKIVSMLSNFKISDITPKISGLVDSFKDLISYLKKFKGIDFSLDVLKTISDYFKKLKFKKNILSPVIDSFEKLKKYLYKLKSNISDLLVKFKVFSTVEKIFKSISNTIKPITKYIDRLSNSISTFVDYLGYVYTAANNIGILPTAFILMTAATFSLSDAFINAADSVGEFVSNIVDLDGLKRNILGVMNTLKPSEDAFDSFKEFSNNLENMSVIESSIRLVSSLIEDLISIVKTAGSSIGEFTHYLSMLSDSIVGGVSGAIGSLADKLYEISNFFATASFKFGGATDISSDLFSNLAGQLENLKGSLDKTNAEVPIRFRITDDYDQQVEEDIKKKIDKISEKIQNVVFPMFFANVVLRVDIGSDEFKDALKTLKINSVIMRNLLVAYTDIGPLRDFVRYIGSEVGRILKKMLDNFSVTTNSVFHIVNDLISGLTRHFGILGSAIETVVTWFPIIGIPLLITAFNIVTFRVTALASLWTTLGAVSQAAMGMMVGGNAKLAAGMVAALGVTQALTSEHMMLSTMLMYGVTSSALYFGSWIVGAKNIQTGKDAVVTAGVALSKKEKYVLSAKKALTQFGGSWRSLFKILAVSSFLTIWAPIAPSVRTAAAAFVLFRRRVMSLSITIAIINGLKLAIDALFLATSRFAASAGMSAFATGLASLRTRIATLGMATVATHTLTAATTKLGVATAGSGATFSRLFKNKFIVGAGIMTATLLLAGTAFASTADDTATLNSRLLDFVVIAGMVVVGLSTIGTALHQLGLTTLIFSITRNIASIPIAFAGGLIGTKKSTGLLSNVIKGFGQGIITSLFFMVDKTYIAMSKFSKLFFNTRTLTAGVDSITWTLRKIPTVLNWVWTALTFSGRNIVAGLRVFARGAGSVIKGLLTTIYSSLVSSPIVAAVATFIVSPLGIALTAITAIVGSIAAVFINHKRFMSGLFHDVFSNGKYYADQLEGIAKRVNSTFSKENLQVVGPQLGDITRTDGSSIKLGDFDTKIEDLNLSGLNQGTVDAINKQAIKLDSLMKSNMETIKSEGKLSRYEIWQTTKAIKELDKSIGTDAKKVDINTVALQASIQSLKLLAAGGVDRGNIYEKYGVGISSDFEKASSSAPGFFGYTDWNPFREDKGGANVGTGPVFSDIEAAIASGNYKVLSAIATDLRGMGSDSPQISALINTLDTLSKTLEGLKEGIMVEFEGNDELLKRISIMTTLIDRVEGTPLGDSGGFDRSDIITALNTMSQEDLGDLVDDLGDIGLLENTEKLKDTINKIGTGDLFGQTRGGDIGGWFRDLLAGAGITESTESIREQTSTLVDALMGIDPHAQLIQLNSTQKRMVDVVSKANQKSKDALTSFNSLLTDKFDLEKFAKLLPTQQDIFLNASDFLKGAAEGLIGDVNSRMGFQDYPFTAGEGGLLELDRTHEAYQLSSDSEKLGFHTLEKVAKQINDGVFKFDTTKLSELNSILSNTSIGISLEGIKESDISSLMSKVERYAEIKAKLLLETDPNAKEELQKELSDLEWDLKDFDTQQLSRIAHKAQELGIDVPIIPVLEEDKNFLSVIEEQLNNLKDIEIGSDRWYIHSANLELSLKSANDVLSDMANMDTAVDLGDLIDGAENIEPVLSQFSLLTAARKKFNDLSAVDILDPKALKEAYNEVKKFEKAAADAIREFGSFSAKFSEATSALGVNLDPAQIKNFSAESMESILELGESYKDLQDLYADATSAEQMIEIASRMGLTLEETTDIMRTQRSAVEALNDMSSQFGINMDEVFIYGSQEVVRELVALEQQMYEVQQAMIAAASADNWSEFQRLQEQLRELGLEGDRLANQRPFWHSWLEGMQSSFSNAFYDILTGAKSFSDGIKDMFDDIAKHIVRRFSQDVGDAVYGSLVGLLTGQKQKGNWLTDLAGGVIGGIVGGGGGGGGGIIKSIAGAFGFQEGGPVTGPGGPTGDKIPAMLSSGEFVINARATKKHRPLLEQINGYQDGGVVGNIATAGSMLTGVLSSNLIEEVLDEMVDTTDNISDEMGVSTSSIISELGILTDKIVAEIKNVVSSIEKLNENLGKALIAITSGIDSSTVTGSSDFDIDDFLSDTSETETVTSSLTDPEIEASIKAAEEAANLAGEQTQSAGSTSESDSTSVEGSQSYSSDDRQNDVIRTYTDIPKATSTPDVPTSKNIIINNLPSTGPVAHEVVERKKIEPENMQVDNYEVIKNRMEELESSVDQSERRDKIKDELYDFINSNERVQIALYDAVLALEEYGPIEAEAASRAFTDDPMWIPFNSQEKQQETVYKAIIEGFDAIKDDLYKQGVALNIEDAIEHVTSERVGIDDLLSSNKDDIVDALVQAEKSIQPTIVVDITDDIRSARLGAEIPVVKIPEITVDITDDARSARLDAEIPVVKIPETTVDITDDARSARLGAEGSIKKEQSFLDKAAEGVKNVGSKAIEGVKNVGSKAIHVITSFVPGAEAATAPYQPPSGHVVGTGGMTIDEFYNLNKNFLNDLENQYGLAENFLWKTFGQESSFGANARAWNPTHGTSARGYFQQTEGYVSEVGTPQEAHVARFGQGVEAFRVAAELAARKSAKDLEYAKSKGVTPGVGIEPDTLNYLLYQQGLGGGTEIAKLVVEIPDLPVNRIAEVIGGELGATIQRNVLSHLPAGIGAGSSISDYTSAVGARLDRYGPTESQPRVTMTASGPIGSPGPIHSFGEISALVAQSAQTTAEAIISTWQPSAAIEQALAGATGRGVTTWQPSAETEKVLEQAVGRGVTTWQPSAELDRVLERAVGRGVTTWQPSAEIERIMTAAAGRGSRPEETTTTFPSEIFEDYTTRIINPELQKAYDTIDTIFDKGIKIGEGITRGEMKERARDRFERVDIARRRLAGETVESPQPKENLVDGGSILQENLYYTDIIFDSNIPLSRGGQRSGPPSVGGAPGVETAITREYMKDLAIRIDEFDRNNIRSLDNIAKGVHDIPRSIEDQNSFWEKLGFNKDPEPPAEFNEVADGLANELGEDRFTGSESAWSQFKENSKKAWGAVKDSFSSIIPSAAAAETDFYPTGIDRQYYKDPETGMRSGLSESIEENTKALNDFNLEGLKFDNILAERPAIPHTNLAPYPTRTSLKESEKVVISFTDKVRDVAIGNLESAKDSYKAVRNFASRLFSDEPAPEFGQTSEFEPYVPPAISSDDARAGRHFSKSLKESEEAASSFTDKVRDIAIGNLESAKDSYEAIRSFSSRLFSDEPAPEFGQTSEFEPYVPPAISSDDARAGRHFSKSLKESEEAASSFTDKVRDIAIGNLESAKDSYEAIRSFSSRLFSDEPAPEFGQTSEFEPYVPPAISSDDARAGRHFSKSLKESEEAASSFTDKVRDIAIGNLESAKDSYEAIRSFSSRLFSDEPAPEFGQTSEFEPYIAPPVSTDDARASRHFSRAIEESESVVTKFTNKIKEVANSNLEASKNRYEAVKKFGSKLFSDEPAPQFDETSEFEPYVPPTISTDDARAGRHSARQFDTSRIERLLDNIRQDPNDFNEVIDGLGESLAAQTTVLQEELANIPHTFASSLAELALPTGAHAWPTMPTTATTQSIGIPPAGTGQVYVSPSPESRRQTAPPVDPTFANIYKYAREPGPEAPNKIGQMAMHGGAKMLTNMFFPGIGGLIAGAMGMNKGEMTMTPTFHLGQALDTSADQLLMAQTRTSGYRDQQSERAGNYRTVGEVQRFRGGNQFVKEHKDGTIQRITNIAGERIYETFKDAADYQKGILHNITGHESLDKDKLTEVINKSGTRLFGNISSLQDMPPEILAQVSDTLNNLRGGKEIKGVDISKELVDATDILNKKLGVDYVTPGAGTSQVVEEDYGFDPLETLVDVATGEKTLVGAVAEGVGKLGEQTDEAIETDIAGTEDLKDTLNSTGQDALNAQRAGTDAVTGSIGDSSTLLSGTLSSTTGLLQGTVVTSGTGVQGAVINSGNQLQGVVTTGFNLLAGELSAVRNAVKPPVVHVPAPSSDGGGGFDFDADDPRGGGDDGGGGGGGGDDGGRDGPQDDKDGDSGGGSSGGGGTQDQRDKQREREERQERQSDFTNVGTNPKDKGTTSTTSTRTSSPSPGSAGPNYGGTGSTSGGMATGGMVYGPGGPTGDKIPAMLSAGEFVVNARSAKIHRPTLEKINKYKDGGSVEDNSYLSMSQDGDSFSLMIETITKAIRPEAELYNSFTEMMENSDEVSTENNGKVIEELILVGIGIKDCIKEASSSIVDTIKSSITESNESRAESFNSLSSTVSNVGERVVSELGFVRSSIESLSGNLSSSLNSLQSSFSSVTTSSTSNADVDTSADSSSSTERDYIKNPRTKEETVEYYESMKTRQVNRYLERKKEDPSETSDSLDNFINMVDGLIKKNNPDYTPKTLEYSTGGIVYGSGGPTGDKIPAMLSSGEFVVNAKAAKLHRPLLERINGYKDGGNIGDDSYIEMSGGDTFSLMIETMTKAIRPEAELYDTFKKTMEGSDEVSIENTTKIVDEIISLGIGIKDRIKESIASLVDIIKTSASESNQSINEGFNNFISRIDNIADRIVSELNHIRSSINNLGSYLSSIKSSIDNLGSIRSSTNTTNNANTERDYIKNPRTDEEAVEYYESIKTTQVNRYLERKKEDPSETSDALDSYINMIDGLIKEKDPDYTPKTLEYSTGGIVYGPGGPIGDKIPAMLSSGEFVINAASTKNYLPLLHGINNGTLDVPKMMAGGLVSGNWMRDMKGYMLGGSHTIPSSDTPSSIHQSSALQSNNAIQNKPGASQTVVNLGVVGDVTEKTVEVVYGMLPEIARAVAQVNRERGYT